VEYQRIEEEYGAVSEKMPWACPFSVCGLLLPSFPVDCGAASDESESDKEKKDVRHESKLCKTRTKGGESR